MSDDKTTAGSTPPAIAPRNAVPRPDVAVASSRPVPAPPADEGADAVSAPSPAPVVSSASAGSPAEAAASVPAAAPVAVDEAPVVDEQPTSSWPARTPGSPADATEAADAPVGGATSAALAAPRKVRLSLARVDPWSVMKLSFLLSVAAGIMIVVATWVFWYMLNDMGVFTSINDMVLEVVGPESNLDVLQYVERDKILSAATLVAVADVVLLTALGTIGAFLYNVTAALVGGVHVTLTDD